MSILIRTGSSKTDLSYTDNAVKNLKVLLKTGTKSVLWITTQPGTTYNNILQKRGVKDLFYGDITIPSDEPDWYGNPYSGSLSDGTLNFTKGIRLIERSNIGYVMPATTQWANGNIFASPNQYITGNFTFNQYSLTEPRGLRIMFKINPDAYFSYYGSPTKLFIVSSDDPNKKIVYLISKINDKWSNDSSVDNYTILQNTFTVRNFYSSIPSIYGSGNYNIGIRFSDS